MKIGVKFNQLTFVEYLQVIEYHQKYTDFNTLGLYRSILENDKLDLVQKIAVRNLAHEKFLKTFEFLQLKDPYIYIQVSTLGQTLTVADEHQLWQNVRINQEKILKDKKIKHRNFGNYSKHDCGYDDCPYNGVMIRQGGFLSESTIRFDSDNHRWAKELKARRDAASKRNFRDNQAERADLLTTE
ncbi:hypothetical protein [Chamaesiphon minutus]|uniref:Uncharacterized protein n=1 Tax=Chamaesiphon minutus (strain ATCC 27169 / PCC 6605) TaxID=1173020 RepID=K9UAQ0_CHAP6|nr:hypothetical protein [Chamaesiphon minutus]AFY91506.1 hypothetical protein Cha6605_0204 [Chamaesiphon minutus PCC 6605]